MTKMQISFMRHCQELLCQGFCVHIVVRVSPRVLIECLPVLFYLFILSRERV